MRQDIILDSAIRDWLVSFIIAYKSNNVFRRVLFPIMVVMVLVGILRHHATQLLNSKPKLDVKGIRESQAINRGWLLRSSAASDIPISAFNARKQFLTAGFEKGIYVKNPGVKGPANPMSDPGGMEMMMEGMKKNMAMIVPQTLIMSWITYFFSGFILIRLPFPLTLRFKQMMQRGIETAEMDVTWVSSISWYFLNLFGLRSVYTLILGDENSAEGVKDMAQMQMGSGQQQQQDMTKVFQSEKEFLDLVVHTSFFGQC
ncbi:ER membrane complex subunit 3 [Nowakowskiella sp. JEL0078]|nr:ER membrane complex subunit 3 [Nowakowskiella sp. JEL0078]